MRLTVNGVAQVAKEGSTVSLLLEALGLRPEIVAVEVNGELVPRSTHADKALVEGDQVEFVTLVGGG